MTIAQAVFPGRFKDRVAIVTGGASGIGAETSLRLAREGARVVVVDVNSRRIDAFRAVAQQATEANAASIESLPLDITDEKAVATAFADVARRHGSLDILVHCAGIVGPTTTPITEYSLDDWKRVIDINLTGSFICAKYAIAQMRDRNRGRIMLVASIAGKDGNPGMSGYTASKAGLIGLVKGLGKEWAKTEITINGLAPAVIRTPMNDDVTPEQLRYMMDKIPMGRLGTMTEAAAMITWAVSDEASFCTGFVFDLSGGRSVY